MKIERRKFPRRMISLTTNILENQTKNILGECLLVNISKNGFAFESETKFSVGQQFYLEFTILHQNVILVGKIKRATKVFFYPLYGVRIIENGCKNLDLFRKYLDYFLI